MSALLPAVGVAILVTAVIDQFATIARAGSGSGFVAPRVHRAIWDVALRLHERRPSHAMLSAVGVVLLVITPILWAVALWGGFWLIFLGDERAIVDATTATPASAMGRAYAAGFSVFTLGTGDLVPGSDGWRLVSAAASFTGLTMITLGITYLVPVTQAATMRRALAREMRHAHRARNPPAAPAPPPTARRSTS